MTRGVRATNPHKVPNSIPDEPLQQRLEAALRKLPNVSAANRDALIPGTAHELAVLGGFDFSSPHIKPGTTAATKRQIATARKQAESLLKSLGTMNATAIEAIKASGLNWPLQPLRQSINIVAARLRAAEQLVPEKPPKRGNRADLRAVQIRAALRDRFEILTGEQPSLTVRFDEKNSGPFVDLVAEVFAILRIDGDAAYHAGQALNPASEEIEDQIQPTKLIRQNNPN